MQRTERPRESRRTPGIVVVGIVLLTTACATIGPKTIPRDQFDYGTAIANAGKEQLLSNIVRLRYVEAPVFVDVSSVINQYALEGEVSLGAGFGNSLTGENAQTIGGRGTFADRPTITYSPISGQKFSRSLLTPITPEAIFALVQAGWPAEVILRLTIRTLNGINNERAAPANRRPADPEFIELLHVWARLRNAGALGLRRQGEEGSAKVIVYETDAGADEQVRRDQAFLTQTLGLDPESNEFELTYGLVPDKPNEIVVLTSSILEIMNELGWRADVPPEHIEDGRTGTGFSAEEEGVVPLIRIGHAKDRPADSHVAIQNRDYWFFVDDRDVSSKRTFALLQILLSLTDSGEAGRGPVVSISN